MMSNIKNLLSETEGVRGRTKQYVCVEGETSIVCIETTKKSSNGILHKVQNTFRNVFLPQGYPSTVSKDYLSYQIWDTIQAFASSLSGSLSTKSVLEGVGVGNSTATPMAATFMWLIKDGSGMVGRILFAWLKGGELDADCKKWRFFADILNDCAMMLELCGPVIVQSLGGSSWLMTALLCTAGTAKSVVGVAGGATRAALTQHQALIGNLADVSAKDGSQETLVNLVALITSLWLLPLLDSSFTSTLTAFLLFTLLHVFANYRAVKSVTMDCFNRTRYLILLQHYFDTREILGIKELNEQEPVFIGTSPSEGDFCNQRIVLGSSVQTGMNSNLKEDLKKFSKKNYAIVSNPTVKKIDIIFRPGCKSEDFLESYALCFLAALVESGKTSFWLKKKEHASVPDLVSHFSSIGIWEELEQKLAEKGWRVDRSLFLPGEWRATW